MRRIATALALALCLVGCAPTPRPDIPIAGDIIGSTCPAEEFLVGLLMFDAESGIAIRDEGRVVHPILWGMHHTFEWSPGWFGGGEFEVLDGSGAVVATTGRSYRIGGQIAQWAGGRFWACAGVFIPL